MKWNEKWIKANHGTFYFYHLVFNKTQCSPAPTSSKNDLPTEILKFILRKIICCFTFRVFMRAHACTYCTYVHTQQLKLSQLNFWYAVIGCCMDLYVNFFIFNDFISFYCRYKLRKTALLGQIVLWTERKIYLCLSIISVVFTSTWELANKISESCANLRVKEHFFYVVHFYPTFLPEAQGSTVYIVCILIVTSQNPVR